MGSATDLQTGIQESANGVTLAELLAYHPGIARRTAQRLIAKLIENELVIARGEGRARRYFAAGTEVTVDEPIGGDDIFPDFIPVSADSQDVLTYVAQPQKARKPVGYGRPPQSNTTCVVLSRYAVFRRKAAPTYLTIP